MRKYTDDLNYNSKNAHKQRLPEIIQVLDLLTDKGQNRSVVDMAKAKNTTNSSAQQ